MKVCPACSESNPDRARLCMMCGEALAEPSAHHEERKVVTVLFADLVGFTSRSEAMDVEDVRGTLQPYHQLLRRELERHGGTVEKFIGDAVMALFGAPTTHEDDAERAVRAALAIQDAVGRLREEDQRLDLHVRIGVNTGEALIALGANPQAGEGMASGDVVNTAARLQSAAPVDGVLVGEATYRATDRAIHYADAEPIVAKGKTAAVPVWRALHPRSLVPEQSRLGGLRLVGREREVGLVVGAFEQSRHDPSTQLVTVVGAPGIGKTRLVEELGAYVEDLPGLIRWRRGRSLSYGEGVAFWALGEMVKVEAGILESDPADVAAGKLRAAVEAAVEDSADREWIERQLRPLVGVDAEVAVSAEGGRSEAFAAWRRFFELLAQERPTALVFEDAHWADDALLDFIDHLAERAGAVPLLIVVTARPDLLERRPTWGGGKFNSHTINLSPLSEADTARLVGELLEQALLPADMQQMLLARAEGNPLYAQEYVRMLRDQGLLVHEQGGWRLRGEPEGLPESVQGIIAARLDTLSGEEKRVLQDAAVVGKTAWLGAVCAIAGSPRWETEELLHRLERRQLLVRAHRSNVAGEVEFSFSHALTQEVAYAQIRRVERAERHERAAEWFEAMSAGRDDKAELLAHHYHTAYRLRDELGEATPTLRGKAQAALAEAGRQAESVNAHAAAARHLTAALSLVAPDDPHRPHLVLEHAAAAYREGAATEELLSEAVRAQAAAEQWEAAAEAAYLLGEWFDRKAGDGERADAMYAQGAEYATRVPYRPVASMIAHRQAFRLLVTGRARQAVEFTGQAMKRAELGGDREGYALLQTWHGDARLTSGDLQGIGLMEGAANLLAERGHRQTSNAFHNLGEALVAVGDLPRAAGARAAARKWGNRIGTLFDEFATAGLAESAYHAGDWHTAMELATPIADVATTLGATYARWTRGRVALALGERTLAVSDGRALTAVATTSRNDEHLFYGLALEALAEQDSFPSEADLALERFFVRWREIGGLANHAPTLAELAPIGSQGDAIMSAATLLPDFSRWKPALIAMAERRHTDAAAIYAEIGSRPLEASAYLSAARRAVATGDAAHADQHAERALSFYRSVDATACIAEAEALMARARSA